jgi:alpha-tubulin suppressor-like RCC1 family protein
VNNSTPQAVVGLIGLARIVAGDDHTCALRTNGAALCWGDNSSGQLGTGDNVASLEPVSVTAL